MTRDSPAWRRARDEPVVLVPYDPSWPEQAAEEIARIRALLPELASIEHFGSTAIPGMPAKPIIDLMAIAPSLTWVHEIAAPRLTAAGYEYLWRLDEQGVAPAYTWFIRRDPKTGARRCHLHFFPPDSDEWAARLRFRDLLRANHALAARYAQLKTELARRYADDRLAYANGKSAFIAEVLAAANGCSPTEPKPS
ncbi:MAG: GrpB family protein [Hydrogenophilus thermoluteolus]